MTRAYSIHDGAQELAQALCLPPWANRDAIVQSLEDAAKAGYVLCVDKIRTRARAAAGIEPSVGVGLELLADMLEGEAP